MPDGEMEIVIPAEDDLRCPFCGHEILPGQPRMSWFTKDINNFTTDRGAVHLSCVRPLALN